MRICIIGAGAIGGMLGARLALAGEQVTFIEKNREHANAIRSDGLRVESEGETIVAHGVAVTDSFAEPGEQDLVIIAVKAHQIPLLLPDIRQLFGPQTILKVTTTFGTGVDGGVVTVAVTVCVVPTGFVAVAGPSEMFVGQLNDWIRPIELLPMLVNQSAQSGPAAIPNGWLMPGPV